MYVMKMSGGIYHRMVGEKGGLIDELKEDMSREDERVPGFPQERSRLLHHLVHARRWYNRQQKGPRMGNNHAEVKNRLEPDPVIEAYKKHIDRTLIRENLRLTVEERFERLMRLQEFASELRRAGREANAMRRGPDD